jgi:hypothetical protein
MTKSIDGVPEKFYKYRSMNGDATKWVAQTVLQNEVYFPAASSFNDPFDLRPVFSLQASPERHREDYLRLSRKFEPHLTEVQRAAEVDRVMATSMCENEIGNTTAHIEAIHSHLISTNIGVFCVSTKWDDILMWSHYADSHRGICLEFDGTLPFMAHAQKVHYADKRVPINLYDDSQETAMEKALLTKSKQWSYESEWRLLRYKDGPGVVRFRPGNLTGIVIGAMTSSPTVDTIMSWIGQRSIPLNLYRASISPKQFALDVAPIRVTGKPRSNSK